MCTPVSEQPRAAPTLAQDALGPPAVSTETPRPAQAASRTTYARYSMRKAGCVVALRTGHGNGRGRPHIEVLPPSELPEGVPGDAGHECPNDRDNGGRFTPGNSLARQGGYAKKGKTRLAERLGLRVLAETSDFREYKAAAVSFRRAQCTELARTVGGGVCGPAPSSMVASAALQLAWSRYLSDLAAASGDPDLALRASKLADASRQNLLAAHEICAKESVRRERSDANPLADFMPRLVPSSDEPKGAA